jgi:hypothetical protein
MRCFLCLFFCLLSLLPGYAAGPRLDIVAHPDCQPSDSEQRLLAAHIQAIGDLLSKHLDVPAKNPEALKLRLFCSREAYQAYQRQHSTTRSATAYYSPSRSELVVMNQSSFLATRRLIQHEATHALLDQADVRLPKWLGEGLAEYMEYLELSSSGIRVLLQPSKVERLQRWLRTEPNQLALQPYFTLSNRAWSESNQADNRPASTLAWGLVYHQMATSEGQRWLAALLALARKGQTLTPELLDQYYPGGVPAWERLLRNYFSHKVSPHIWSSLS